MCAREMVLGGPALLAAAPFGLAAWAAGTGIVVRVQALGASSLRSGRVSPVPVRTRLFASHRLERICLLADGFLTWWRFDADACGRSGGVSAGRGAPGRVRNLPDDLARPDRVLADETLLCRSRWGQAARHPQFLRRGLCQLGATSFRWWELVAGHTLLGAASDPPGVS
jgi:hypothetical protein